MRIMGGGGRKQLEGSVRVQGEFYFSMSGEIWEEEEVERFMWRDDV